MFYILNIPATNYGILFMPLVLEQWFSTFNMIRITWDDCEKRRAWKFPGGPMVRTGAFTAQGLGSIPGEGTKIPQATQHSQKKKKKN